MNIFRDEQVPYIPVFGFHHMIYILLMVGLLILLIKNHQYIREHSETVRKVILGVSIFQQVLLYSWYIFETGFDLAEALPFHISRISTILGIIFLLTKNLKIMDVLFYFGLYAYGSFFYPQRVYPFYHVIGVSFFINHAVTILLPIFCAIVYNWRPEFTKVFQAYTWFLIYFTFVYLFNPIVDGNYFYLKYRPFFSDLSESIYISLVLLATLAIFLIGYAVSRIVGKIWTREK